MELVKYVDALHGKEMHGGLVRNVANYERSTHLGRIYAPDSAQTLSNVGRAVGFASHAIDIDIGNAHPQLFRSLLIRIGFGERVSSFIFDYPYIELYCSKVSSRHRFAQDYLGEEPENASLVYTKISFVCLWLPIEVPFFFEIGPRSPPGGHTPY